jgi:hypothetical protein
MMTTKEFRYQVSKERFQTQMEVQLVPSDLLRQVAVIRRRRVHHAKLAQMFKNFLIRH